MINVVVTASEAQQDGRFLISFLCTSGMSKGKLITRAVSANSAKNIPVGTMIYGATFPEIN
jgi:hypothetical protein